MTPNINFGTVSSPCGRSVWLRREDRQRAQCHLPVRARTTRPPRDSDFRSHTAAVRLPITGLEISAKASIGQIAKCRRLFVPWSKNHLDQINPFIVKAYEGRKAQLHPHALGQQPGAYGLGRDSTGDSLSQHHRPEKCRTRQTGTTASSPTPAAISTARNPRRSFASVMKLSSTRTRSPRSSGYFAAISRRCELRSLRGAGILGKRFRESIYRGLFAQSGAEGADSIIQAWATPEELGCPEHRALKERRWRLARRAVCFAAG